MFMLKHVIFGLIMVLYFVEPVFSRQIPHWPYERLFREADVVVIASVKSTVPAPDHPTEDFGPLAVVAQDTAFEVMSVLKGTIDDGSDINVLHFKIADDKPVQNGPLLAQFRREGPVVRGEVGKSVVLMGRPEYLLFLKKMADGRFEPVSGQFDFAISVREIYANRSDLFTGKVGDEAPQ